MTTAEDLDALWESLTAFEGVVREAQHGIPNEGPKSRLQRTGRTDLMPGRHLAIALTDLESARLRIGEAARLLEDGSET